VVLSAPEALIAFRAACAPAMFVLACFGVPGPLLAAILFAGFLSDVLDGIVARRQGIATAGLRHADTLVDTVFYITASVALRIAVPDVFLGSGAALVVMIAVHVSRTTFELTKYGRIASYHMWSSKTLGVLLLVTMTTVFVTLRPNALVAVTLWVGVANELEGFTASIFLPRWTADVPSVVHAYRLSRLTSSTDPSRTAGSTAIVPAAGVLPDSESGYSSRNMLHGSSAAARRAGR
jgi:CDP-diacylglycerol--glycerol-3-phosphate 3-phosphatidyltransferase